MNEIPFGYNYNGNNVTIKLRIKLNNWLKAPVQKEIGQIRYTKTGYIIFSCSLNTASEEYIYVSERLKQQRDSS